MEQAKKNIFSRIVDWAKEIKSELKKVVWPSFAKVRKNTIIVIIYVLIVGAVIAALDWVFLLLFNFIIK